MIFLECDRLVGRLRRICRGELMSRSVCDAYRAKWGMGPLPADCKPTTVVLHVDMPPLLQRVRIFATALTQHVADNLKRCKDEEINRRLKICEGCTAFTGHHCRECGCACNENQAFFNKLAWQSEKCPLKHW